MSKVGRPVALLRRRGRFWRVGGAALLALASGWAHGGPPVAESIFASGLADGWSDSGWCARDLSQHRPAEVHFGDKCVWLLAKPGLQWSAFGALVFRARAGATDAFPALELRVDSTAATSFPRIRLRPDHRQLAGDGFWEVRVSLRELNPDDRPFDRLVFRAVGTGPKDTGLTLVDQIALTPGDAATRARDEAARALPVTASVDGEAPATAISPGIYGIGYDAQADKADVQWRLGATARRFGGNASSRYNWQIGAWNTCADWFYENHPVPSPHDKFLADDRAHGLGSALTVPLLGWVAKDDHAVGFPVKVFGPQGRTDPYLSEAGDGTAPSGTALTPKDPSLTSIAAPPEFIGQWVKTLAPPGGPRRVDQYILDNEPMNWTRTHRDVRQAPLGYDELLERTVRYATAVRAADPPAVIAGPAFWGWTAYFYSALDGASGFLARSDRRAHGDVPLVEWYLRKLRAREAQTGVRLLDVLDLHFYPQGERVWGNGGDDQQTSELRVRQTRGLWDPSYSDESWIKEPVALLPRMQGWVQRSYPGTKISIGEWNFGGEKTVSGAIAVAEALGRFAQFGVYSAFYWTFPPEGTPAVEGFKSYRNFDGQGGRFLDYWVPVHTRAATASGANDLSVFASRDRSGSHLVVVEINRSPTQSLLVNLQFPAGQAVTSSRAYGFGGGRAVLTALPPETGDLLTAWSIKVIDLQLASPLQGSLQPPP